MGKFNKKDEGVKPTIVNHMGEKAYKPNAEEELVSTIMTTMLSDSYYEKEKDKVNRIKDLIEGRSLSGLYESKILEKEMSKAGQDKKDNKEKKEALG